MITLRVRVKVDDEFRCPRCKQLVASFTTENGIPLIYEPCGCPTTWPAGEPRQTW